MNAKQQRFVEEYLVDLNATQAAIRAGYSFGRPVGFYTYLLIDPRDKRVFYVGKGKGARMSVHARRAAVGHVDNADKCRRIREIRAADRQVVELVFASHDSEEEAFMVERALILALRSYGLTNIAGGVVANDELVRERARFFLAHMKPFDVWIATASPQQLRAATVMRGTPALCHEAIRRELLTLAAAHCSF